MKVSLFKAVNANRIMCRTLKAAAVCLPLMLSSCVYEDALQEAECGNPDQLTLQLNLTLPAANQGTRTGGHEEDPGIDAESYIDFENGDFRVLVYGIDGELVDNLFKDDFTYELKSTGGNTTVYTLSGTMSVPDAETRQKLSKLRFMVVANWESFEKSNTRPNYNYPTFEGCGLTAGASHPLYYDNENFNFTFKGTTGSSWTPSKARQRYIPMFGVTPELDLDYVVAMSHYSDSPVSNIAMIRALAKVELVDVEGDLISSASLSKVNAAGRFIPNLFRNPTWDQNATQVSEPSLPATPGAIENLQFMLEENTPGRKVLSAYIPEMDLTSWRPEFRIYTGTDQLKAGFNNYDAEGKVVTDPEKELKSVLRNHIYRFNMTAKNGELYLTLNVLPWQMEYAENPWYFDAPELAPGGEIDWSNAVAEGYVDDAANYRLVMKDGTDDYAEAQFEIAAPQHCRWFAQLVALNGKSDAFEFADGYDSGIIGEGPCIIRIRNTREIVTDYDNEARLVVFVEYPDKTTREIKVTPDGESNYMIVQIINNI